ncbi:oxidized low-density lipoprotein receptor 1 isoform X2 [Pocillopora verrucosa]|uniref:oxidized low-density lipoprotein receptor 1 isoform X2 n=1 Tax=Pocillopora verrucosa TaxID=203993 RepID=UPI00333F4ADB
MGQLLVKFKEWREKLELSHEKAKHGSSRTISLEQKLLPSEDDQKPTKDYGATHETKTLPSSDELFTKLDTLERVLDDQKKFLEDHDAKIQEIENFIRKLANEREENQQEVKLSDPWRRFEQHKQILTSHEERLEKNATKIEIIKEMLDDIQGGQGSEVLKQKLKEYKELLKKGRECYERLKEEVEEQLQIQQKQLDNMLAGFIVGFVVLVIIFMVPRTLLTSG